MKHNIKYMFLYLISLLLLLSSCSSIYSEAEPITPITKIEVDPNEEYFTLGTEINKEGNTQCIYNGCWIYSEYQEYQEHIRTKPDGEKIYVGRKIRRFVKYNPYTDTVSSPCLDPICTHGPGSGCVFIVPNDAMPDIKGMIGDWFLFGYSYELSTELGFFSEAYAYNLSTGELIQLSDYDPSAKVISQPKGWCTFGNKKYVTIQVLDYTDTDYIHKGERNELDGYMPETKWYLCEMDFDTKKFTELFEVPEDYRITAVTNKRFYFIKETFGDEVFSSNHDGTDMRKEDVFNFSPQNFCGTYGYLFDDTIRIYDLRTNTSVSIAKEYSYQRRVLTNEGILCSTFSTADENYQKLRDSRTSYEVYSDYVSDVNKYRYEATSQIYLMGFNGQGKEIVYEGDGMILDAYYKSGKFLYCIVGFPDPNNGYKRKSVVNDGRSVINIETGEITQIPLLELIIPEEYK